MGGTGLDKADILQNENEKRIEVKILDKVNRALINIDKNGDKATLRFKQKGKRWNKEHHLRNTNRFILKHPVMSLKQLRVYIFLIFCQARVPELIFSMISDYGTRSVAPALEILGQDDVFKQALKKTKNDFEKRYRLILGK